MDLSRQLGRQLAARESAAEPDSRATLHQAIPERIIPDADGGNHTDTRNDSPYWIVPSLHNRSQRRIRHSSDAKASPRNRPQFSDGVPPAKNRNSANLAEAAFTVSTPAAIAAKGS